MRFFALGQLAFALAFVPLRWRIGQGLGWDRAWIEGWSVGLYFDLVLAFLPWALARGLSSVSRRLEVPLRMSFALLLWAASLANGLYFLFFQSKLHWWIVKDHWSDVFLVQGEVGQLSNSWATFLSLALCFVAFVLWTLEARAFMKRPESRKRQPVFRRGVRALQGLGGLAVVLSLQQWPLGHRALVRHWLRAPNDVNELRSVAYDHPLIAWFTQWLPQRPGPFATQGSVQLLALDKEGRRRPEQWLAAFRDGFAQSPASYVGAAPLEKDFVPDPKLRAAWLRMLGLPAGRPLNVIHLFVESFRAFEYLDPRIGPAVFPQLHALADRHAVFYSQAYSSVFAPGQTVRGVMSVNCSFLENLLGPATVIGNPLARLRCLQELAGEHGYGTYWLAAHLATFHNKDQFEARHGTQHILSRESYIDPALLPKDPFLLPDAVFYPALLRKLSEIHAGGKPFFLHSINVATHAPWIPRQPERLPESLRRLVSQASDPQYLGYLSTFHLFDEAVSRFIEDFLKSPLADDTVLVLMGDHSVPLDPPLTLSRVQREETKFRVPVFIFAKGLKTGLRVDTPIHQSDISPTSATIAGLAGPATWLGRALSPGAGPATPWVFDDDERALHYRNGAHACYTLPGTRAPACYAVAAGQDPLLQTELSPLPEDPKESLRYRSVAEASFLALTFNRIMRPKASSGR